MAPRHEAKIAAPLNALSTIEPRPVCVVQEETGWELLEMTVDSGAPETMIPPQAVEVAPTAPSESSKRGVVYEVANGERVPNLGEKRFRASTEEGLVRDLRAQVADINRPLLSVSKLVATGHTIVFGPGGSYIHDPNGDHIWMNEAGGMYTLRLWVPKNSKQQQTSAGF